MQLLEQPKDFQYLVQHAIPDCLPPFLKFVELDMKRFDERRQPNFIDDIIDLSPYLDMLGKHFAKSAMTMRSIGLSGQM